MVKSALESNDGYSLWLGYRPLASRADAYRRYEPFLARVCVIGSASVCDSAASELHRGLSALFGRSVSISRSLDEGAPTIVAGVASDLAPFIGSTADPSAGFRIALVSPATIALVGATPADVLYAAFRFLRLVWLGAPPELLPRAEAPSLRWRMLNHWDNLDGSIERGYAGRSLWKWDELPGTVDPRYEDYARACASVGLNGAVLNNVNASAQILDSPYLLKVAAIADVLRRYGVSCFLSANFAAPKTIGGLSTADPLDPEVVGWWRAKVAEIYRLIPDFGGFLVKADSEGQPGPFAYGRDHAEGANALASALEPFGGIVIWRAFVYGHGESDRAKKAFAEFTPLDGKFSSNVALQVKNGAIDFQPREPPHPLFGAMKKTPVFMEFQVTQEYLGQGNHLVYLAPMWKEILDFDLRRGGMRVSDSIGGIAAVSNVGNDRDWCGHPFHSANWFAYGRLAWDPSLSADEIAREWVACVWGDDPEVSAAALALMGGSWETCVDYMTPLCLHHIMREGHHYGPDPGDETPAREDWRPTYYHRASRSGLGFDRTRRGSAAVDQYARDLADEFDDIDRCPEKYLLWFHHAPWTRVLSSGRKLFDEIRFRYRRGVESVEAMVERWRALEGKVDDARFRAVAGKLAIQLADAREWESTCVEYFARFTQWRNLLGEYGYSDETIERRVREAWAAIFENEETRFYFETDDGCGYLVDTGNDDVRTEGMSYGMMMAVQMDRKDIFDRVWKWARTRMYMETGRNAGYFAWSCARDGTRNADGPAPDGEEFFAMALFLASRRWGEGPGIFAYAAEARSLLRDCVHTGETGAGNPMWDPETKLIKFVPSCPFTDPSYHLPQFYDYFAEFAYPGDRAFWKAAAAASRAYLPRSCHPATGLAPEYSYYDGSPNGESGHGDFYSDSYRVTANIGLNALWSSVGGKGDPALSGIASRVVSFFDRVDTADLRRYSIDGTALEEKALHPVGLVATIAAGAVAADSVPGTREACVRAVERFMDTPPRAGERRYYDNCLYFFALLILSGRYRAW